MLRKVATTPVHPKCINELLRPHASMGVLAKQTNTELTADTWMLVRFAIYVSGSITAAIESSTSATNAWARAMNPAVLRTTRGRARVLSESAHHITLALSRLPHTQLAFVRYV